MNRISILALACCLLPAGSSADLSASRRTAVVSAVESVLPATVTIGAERIAVQQVNPFRSLHDDFFSDWFSDPFFGQFSRAVRVKSLGSGILVNKRGLILTNDHVVAGAEEIVVTLADGRTFPARLKGRGLPLDIALLEIVQPKGAVDLPFVTLGTAEDLALGEWAIAIGAPSNLEASVTVGVISAVGRRLPQKKHDYTYLGMIQTDASINPGNSGGPLVNADGKVIGINTVIISQSGGSEGLGFAICADQARKVLMDLVEDGVVRMAWFGWELSEGKPNEGLVIRKIHAPSAASEFGISPGSVLLALNGKPVRTGDDYEQILLSIRIGQTVTARISESGAERTVRVTAARIPPELLAVDLGLVVQDVSARYRRASAAGGGVVVTQIRSDGYFGQTESPLEPGDIIVEIGGQRIDSVESYESAARKLKKNTRVDMTIRRRNVLLRFTLQL